MNKIEIYKVVDEMIRSNDKCNECLLKNDKLHLIINGSNIGCYDFKESSFEGLRTNNFLDEITVTLFKSKILELVN